jgi:hypothetical protein
LRVIAGAPEIGMQANVQVEFGDIDSGGWRLTALRRPALQIHVHDE